MFATAEHCQCRVCGLGLLIVGEMAQVDAVAVSAKKYSMEERCARIVERHRHRFKVRKQQLVVANLSRIVSAFLKLSNRKGFHATSLRELAEASGLSMGGLYTYFDSKETLLVMVLDEVTCSVKEMLKSVPPAVNSDPETHLLWIIDAHIRLTEAMQPWFVFAFMEAKAFPVNLRRAAVDSELMTEKALVDVIEKGIAKGAFSADSPPLFASLVKPLLQDWYVKRSKYRKRNVDIDSYIGAVQSMVGKTLIPTMKRRHPAS